MSKKYKYHFRVPKSFIGTVLGNFEDLGIPFSQINTEPLYNKPNLLICNVSGLSTYQFFLLCFAIGVDKGIEISNDYVDMNMKKDWLSDLQMSDV